ncbi:MAG: AMP-binding protein [Spirochaetales bacterium]|nr:AMP-binding protein [Spirochaetales bacterium]
MANEKESLAKRLRSIAQLHPETIAQLSKNPQGDFEPTSYSELYRKVKTIAAALAKLGIERGSHVGLISDNRKEWLLADLALLCLGAVDVPRGSDSTADELGYILGHADCKFSFVESRAQIDNILSRKEKLPGLRTLISFENQSGKENGLEIVKFSDLLGSDLDAKDDSFIEGEIEKGEPDDLATIIYTSGTTGEPKGVMLTHRNYLFQLDRIHEHVHISHGEIYMSVLPAWHSFERAVEYVVLNAGATIAYSKLVGPILKADMLKVRPHWTAAVPRLWEAIRAGVYRNIKEQGGMKPALFNFFVSVGGVYALLRNMVRGLLPQFNKRIQILDFAAAIIPFILITPLNALGQLLVFSKIKKGLMGGRLIAAISGGGALPPYVDRFFQAAGISLLEGYGLTETAPVLSVRLQRRPVAGTVGPLLRDVQARVVGESMEVLPPGQKGVLFVKSEQIMKGYYKRQEATDAVIKDGWLDTGDIVMMTHQGCLKIIGRAKETIVLLGGENIEPTPIEDMLKTSPAIDQVMLVGQDQKFLAALIVPDEAYLMEFAKERNISYVDKTDLLENIEVQELFRNEIQTLVSAKNGFKAFERIFRFKLLPKQFEVGVELTHTLKVRRNVVTEKYEKELRVLFA